MEMIGVWQNIKELVEEFDNVRVDDEQKMVAIELDDGRKIWIENDVNVFITVPITKPMLAEIPMCEKGKLVRKYWEIIDEMLPKGEHEKCGMLVEFKIDDVPIYDDVGNEWAGEYIVAMFTLDPMSPSWVDYARFLLNVGEEFGWNMLMEFFQEDFRRFGETIEYLEDWASNVPCVEDEE